MNRRVLPLTFEYFLDLLESAQTQHTAKDEPIPKLLSKEGREKLLSSLKTPFEGFGGKDFYPGFRKKAAILFYLLIKNHCLENGNKRMACLCLAFFCILNGYEFYIPQNEFYNLAIIVTNSHPDKKDECLKMIISKLRKYTKKITYGYYNRTRRS